MSQITIGLELPGIDNLQEENVVRELLRTMRGVRAYCCGEKDKHTDLGSALARSGRLPEAIEEFQTALRLDPAYEEARRNLAEAQSGGWTETHSSRGIALLRAGDSSGAIVELEAALRIEPNDADAEINLGVALSGFPGRLPGALRHLEEAGRLRPDPELQRAIAHLRTEQQ